MISNLLRVFLYALAAAYAVTGAVLFFAPTWASGHFAWRVSSFVAMTIGGLAARVSLGGTNSRSAGELAHHRMPGPVSRPFRHF